MPGVKKIKKKVIINKENNSGLSAFVERPIPTEDEVENFEKVVDREVRHQEIDSNLTEIYSDKEGALVNVKKMNVKRKQIFAITIFKRLFTIVLLGLVAYFSYFYFFTRDNDMGGVEFIIVAPDKIKAGEEFSYKIEYRNPTKFSMSNLRLELQYPENFIFSSASLDASSGNYGFNLPDLASGANGSLVINGRLISVIDSVNVISGRFSYVPLNFSSEFRKESSAATVISDLGFQVALETPNTVFLGTDNELSISLFNFNDSYLGDFNVRFILSPDSSISQNKEDAAASSTASSTDSLHLKAVSQGGDSWLVSGLNAETSGEKLRFNYLFKSQPDITDLTIRLEKKLDDGQAYTFWEKTISPEIVKSDLNLVLFLNGSKNNGAASFDEVLNYTVNYSNKGSNSFKDAVIMAVLDGYFLNTSSISADKNGEISGGKIVWTKAEIPALSEIKPGDEGDINFSVRLKKYQESDFGQKLETTAYVQYGIDNKTTSNNSNKSNIINTKINSDLSLLEQVRYFNDDNAPVGSGPLPPKVGEKTSLKVYWTVKNNLHELSATNVVLNLPAQVSWNESTTVSVGDLYYNSAQHAVIWNIGFLPVSVYQLDASFSISVSPTAADYDKILILSPGSVITAFDNETQVTIKQKITPKTTRLEDDDIAGLNNSGRVVQ